MTVQPYQTYRNSGADYLGDVPAHWDVRPLKHLASFTSGGTPSKERPEFWDGEIPWASAKDLKMEVLLDTADHITDAAVDEGGAQLVAEGAVLVLVRGMMLARMFPVCVVGQPMAINQDLKALMPRPNVRGDYLAWLLRGTAPETLNRLDEAGHGTKALRMDAWVSMKLPVPPEPEQEAIAAFLDRETAKIDALMDAQRRLIELLKEKRQAAISDAVTKGLDRSAPMKDSGVDWLGEIPAHWHIMPLKRDLRFLTSGSRGWAEHYSDDGALFIRIGNLTRDRIDLDLSDIQRVNVPEGVEGERTRICPGDLLFSITAYLGSVAVAPDNLETAFVSQHVALARLNAKRLLPRWAALVASSKVGQTYLDMRGYGGTKVQLALDDVASLLMTVPPLEEQATILAEIERVMDQFDLLSTEAQTAIALLQERRAALISAAVTGKVDVRGWTAAEVRTAVAAEIIRLHARKPTFGRVKNQKLLYLAEAHAGITEIGGRYERKAAGPYDADLIALVERDLEAAGVMTVSQPEGTGSTVSYSLNRSWKPDNEGLKAMLGGRLAAFEQVNAKLADLKTRDAEAVATLYAVWNDALIDGEACDDARVIRGFLDEWHPEKREKFKQAELHTWLGWMRRNGIVPSGRGPRTGFGGLFG